MKRILAAVVAAALLAGSCLAAPAAAQEPLNYSNVREQLLASNPQLKTISINIDGAKSSIREIDRNAALTTSFDAINAQISAINAAEMDAVASGNPLSAAQLAENKAKIAQLQQQQSALLSSASQLYSTRDSLKTSLESLRFTKRSTLELLVYSAQTLISAQYQLQNQEKQLTQTEADFARQQKIAAAMYRVGRATDSDLKALEYQKDVLDHTRQTLARQKNSLSSQLNLLLARDFEAPLTFAEFKLTEPKNENGEALSADDYETLLAAALDVNIDIAAQRYTYENSTRFSATYRAAEEKLSELKRQFKADFNTAFYDVFDAEDSLRLERNTLTQKQDALRTAELRYQRGYCSANEYAAAQSAVTMQELAVSNAEIQYQNAVLKLESFQNGGWPK